MKAVEQTKEGAMRSEPRNEQEVFENLASLTASPGYVHALAKICQRDNMVAWQGQLKASDLEKLFGDERLIRTEVTTLLGLMVKAPLDLALQSNDVLDDYIKRTDQLMAELHAAMGAPSFRRMLEAAKAGGDGSELWTGEGLREPIFYGGESAYTFQYRDFLVDKWGADDPWLAANKGFTIRQAQDVARTMCTLMDEKSTRLFARAAGSELGSDTWLQAFEQSPEEIAFRSSVPLRETQAVLDALTLQGGNTEFRALGDFNAVAATPLLQTGRGTVLLFQHYGIYEALYESPFHWMWADKAYRGTLSAHRGEFTERFAARRLAGVFGRQHVHSNVNLARTKGSVEGEVDVLVVFGDRLIIVQAKSKKLTLEARKGNDGQLRKDFAGAIQDSYDQAWSCANLILSGDVKLFDPIGNEVVLPHAPKEIHIFCLVAEHYPALAFQARQMLDYQTSEVVRPPFVMDVFLLDALTEMLASPLRLLSYVDMRVKVVDQVVLSHEFTALAFHLRRNLWLDADYDMVMLDDTVAIDLDTAMTVRRENLPGARTPPGILTNMAGTLYERLVAQLEDRADPASVALGLELLSMSEDSARNVHRGLQAIAHQTKMDGQRHDFTLGRDASGFCFHCNPVSSEEARLTLQHHCERRKYRERAPRWFGVSVDRNANLQFGLALEFRWEQSDAMDAATQRMKTAIPAASLVQLARTARQQKVGRNDPCSCGSGKKYKKCCLGAS